MNVNLYKIKNKWVITQIYLGGPSYVERNN